MTDRQYSGYSGTPIRLRTNAPRQTEAQRYPKRQRPIPFEDEEDNPDAWTVEKPHSTARRYDIPTTQFQPKPTRVITQRRFDRATLVIWLCMALIVMIVGWWLFSWVGNWWQGVYDNWRYGDPRTFQADHYMGFGDSPAHPDHFIVLNLHGVIKVIQINPTDSTKDTEYVVTKVDNDSVPATLSFQDVNEDGKMDVLVTIGDSNPYTVVMLNNGKTLQPTQTAH